MPGKKRNRGITWNPDYEVKLQGVPLPPKIKCHRCEKNLPTVKFSEKQLNDFRAQVYQTYGENTTSRIVCRRCIGGAQAIVEMECTICGKTKVLEAFARSQRKVPDTARCWKCTEEILSLKPVDDQKYLDIKNSNCNPEPVPESSIEYFSSATSAESASIDEWADYEESMKTGKKTSCGLNSAMEHMSVHGTASESDLVSTVGDILERGSNPHTRSWHTASVSSAASNTGSVHSYASSVAERSGSTGTTIISPTPFRSGPMRLMGYAAHELEGADTNPWDSDFGSEEEDEDDGEIDSDDSDGENTVI